MIPMSRKLTSLHTHRVSELKRVSLRVQLLELPAVRQRALRPKVLGVGNMVIEVGIGSDDGAAALGADGGQK